MWVNTAVRRGLTAMVKQFIASAITFEVYNTNMALEEVWQLTHISLASFLWDIGKQDSLRCDAAKRGVPSGAILFAYMNFIEK